MANASGSLNGFSIQRPRDWRDPLLPPNRPSPFQLHRHTIQHLREQLNLRCIRATKEDFTDLGDHEFLERCWHRLLDWLFPYYHSYHTLPAILLLPYYRHFGAVRNRIAVFSGYAVWVASQENDNVWYCVCLLPDTWAWLYCSSLTGPPSTSTSQSWFWKHFFCFSLDNCSTWSLPLLLVLVFYIGSKECPPSCQP